MRAIWARRERGDRIVVRGQMLVKTVRNNGLVACFQLLEVVNVRAAERLFVCEQLLVERVRDDGPRVRFDETLQKQTVDAELVFRFRPHNACGVAQVDGRNNEEYVEPYADDDHRFLGQEIMAEDALNRRLDRIAVRRSNNVAVRDARKIVRLAPAAAECRLHNLRKTKQKHVSCF